MARYFYFWFYNYFVWCRRLGLKIKETKTVTKKTTGRNRKKQNGDERRR